MVFAYFQEYLQLFKMFDTDGSGAIGREELKEAMISIGLGQTNDAEIDRLISEVSDEKSDRPFDHFGRTFEHDTAV